MKNKKILALAIASILGLTACGDDSTDLRIDDTIKDSLNRQSSIAFDLISTKKTVSTPTNLLMDTSDGTLNIPIDKDDDKTRANPAVAMGDTDGWSPTQPFIIKLDLPTGVTLTTDSALLHAAVKIAKVDVSRANIMSNPVALTAGVDYTVISTGTSLAVLPLKGSLEHGSDYIYAITDALVDSSGQKLGMSTSYAALKNKQIDQTGSKLEIPQKIVLQVEGLMDAYGIADYENIIYSSWFTTSSAGEALYFTKLATALTLQSISVLETANAVWSLASDPLLPNSANPNNLDLTGLYNPIIGGITPEPISDIILKSSGVDITAPGFPIPNYDIYLDSQITAYKGKIKLPSFLERDVADDKWRKTPWQSAMPSLAIIFSVLNSGSDAEKLDLGTQLGAAGIDPSNLADPAEQLKLIGQSFTLNGEQLDSERLITKYSPLPQVKVVEDVNYLLITPKTYNGNPVSATNKVPIVIYQHGITSIKENILASAGTALINGYAILAIDLPLHGERALSDGTVTTGLTPAVFMNLEYLTVARDNMRQAVADLIGLRAGITTISGYQALGTLAATHPLGYLDTTNVSFFGHSLGAMTGISLQATIDRPMPSGNDSFAIDKTVFANPGGNIPYLLINSDFFGGTIKHTILGSINTDYQTFVGTDCGALTSTECFNDYYDNEGDQETIKATFQSFAVAAQTVFDTVDPFALARDINPLRPVYLAQVKGDLVVPNSFTGTSKGAPYSPTLGTTPLIAQLGLTDIYSDNTSIKKVALLNKGGHSSAIAFNPTTDPAEYKAITDELQSHITSFLASSDGSTATTIDESLLTEE
ncbi:Hydrolases of the alpha/beta superfamily [Moritella viscosa]|uniref:VolA/Pla-1 family phospholipase n=1 Tax=Moritella viscosa TaxID=80854 RepID=UPI000508EED0|nr:VolA/Pla-1 family phospholipase [Moritella viscosa]CED59778.1 putative lipoprotein [Moritella viscosa]SHO03184.1 Hydrolases of the alpha/beta superfamily [Moritella viscosa]SHO20920.1 Hydrolases of the alpha/beta superfamily [Moritella viscosa]